MCPHTALGRKTPEEVFTGSRPEVSHIRIFGSVCYCHVHAGNRKKLDPYGEKGLLDGYNKILKAYRVYIPTRKRIIVSRDVQFDEDGALRRYGLTSRGTTSTSLGGQVGGVKCTGTSTDTGHSFW